jgi:hypothetical protein
MERGGASWKSGEGHLADTWHSTRRVGIQALVLFVHILYRLELGIGINLFI